MAIRYCTVGMDQTVHFICDICDCRQFFGFNADLVVLISAILVAGIIRILNICIEEQEGDRKHMIGKMFFFNAWLLVLFYVDVMSILHGTMSQP